MRYIFRPSAEKQFAKLDPDIQLTIVHKLQFFASCSNPLMYAKRLKHLYSGQYRFRIGDYRVVFDMEENTCIILAVGHRKDIYR